jgi:hypothetical protein
MIGGGAILFGALVYVIIRGPGAVIKAFAGLFTFALVIVAAIWLCGGFTVMEKAQSEARRQQYEFNTKWMAEQGYHRDASAPHGWAKDNP